MSATDPVVPAGAETPLEPPILVTRERLEAAIAWASSPLNPSNRWGSIAPLLIPQAVADILRGLVAIDDPALLCACGHLQVWHGDAAHPCFGAGWDGCRCTGLRTCAGG